MITTVNPLKRISLALSKGTDSIKPPVGSVNKGEAQGAKSQSLNPVLKSFELVSIRQKAKAEAKKKKAQSVGADDTRLDTTVTILDLDDIDTIHGSFKLKFKVHAIYKFDVNAPKLKSQEGDADESSNESLPVGLNQMPQTAVLGNVPTIGEDEETTTESPSDLETKKREELMLDKISYSNVSKKGNIFNELFYRQDFTEKELEKLRADPNSVSKRRQAKAIAMEDEDGNVTSTYYKSYNLTPEETAHFMSYYSVPVIGIDNLSTQAGDNPVDFEKDNRITLYFETSGPDSRKEDGQLSVMWTRDYEFVMKEVFELQNFPFDYQDLSVDFSIDDNKKFDFRITNVRIAKPALEQTEWTLLEPNVKWSDSKTSTLHVRVGRKSGYYIQNVVLLMASIAALGMMAFFVTIDDLGTRTSISLTLLLTLVAFKFVLASELPVISYNTLLDYYVLFVTYTLVAMTICAIIPHNIEVFMTDDSAHDNPDFVNGYMRYVFAGILGGGTTVWFVICWAISNFGSEHNESKVIQFSRQDSIDTSYDYKMKYWVRSSDAKLDESNNQKANPNVIPTLEQQERDETDPYYYKQGVPIQRSGLVVRQKHTKTLF